MKYILKACLVAIVCGACSSARRNAIVPFGGGANVYTQLVWHDEFDGEGTLDTTRWSHEHGFIRNKELQYYTSRLANARQEGGNLIITCARDSVVIDGAMRPITSASVTTQHKAPMLYGRIEVRAKLPSGRGAWPAIWMLPDVWPRDWPGCGEIDIMEYLGSEPDEIFFTTHTQKYNSDAGTERGSRITVENAENDFHVYAIEWFEDRIDWYFDRQQVLTVAHDEAGWEAWPFDAPFHLIINYAFGGEWNRDIDPEALPQQFLIDYVRFFTAPD